ncbi:MAG: galactokinase [Candidatus Poribacteria bacterium]|nr:galactokinase [Candidatus Poribacteria bacterium]
MRQEKSVLSNKLQQEFNRRFGHPPDFIVSAPGRVNLIGEHTDYNDGFVFPVAIDKYLYIAASKRSDCQVHLHALDRHETCTFSLEAIEDTKTPPWGNYLRGVAHFLLQEQVLREIEHTLNGMSAVIAGNVPISAGLSSSAALEVASALAFLGACGLEVADTGMNSDSEIELIEIPPMKLAALCQRAENEFAGVNCGIMDQSISLLGKADHALFLDCRSLEYKQIPLNFTDILIVICNTNVKRELASSEYNKRRAECEKGVEILQRWMPSITSLRDVTLADFKKYEAELPQITQKRCRYVVEENTRVQNAVDALIAKSIDTFGELMNASHAGLRDAYEVSCDELNILVDIAQSIDGVIGARMTGAGFGGCTVNLVYQNTVEEFQNRVMKEYTQRTGIEPDTYICNVGDGARIKWSSHS